jgi:cyclic GMP-AMP synthase DncV-like protein
MYDCSDDVLAFHNNNVTLLQAQRTEMRDRRNANRKRLKDRLKETNFPLPQQFIKQGSYAMLAMVQDADNDYDIDDGVYFSEDDLKDKDGKPLTPSATRQRVCDALQDKRFNKQPKVLKNCVRVYYNEGYHVDMPIYRIRKSDGEYELAAGDEWTLSRAADVEKWFNDANNAKSPDEDNGRQFRRIVRNSKKFARSRSGWKDEIASGFTVTKLVDECYVANKDREDVALRQTMQGVYDRLKTNLEVSHPTTPGAKLTAGPDDSGTAFLRDKLKTALDDLAILDDPKCTATQARQAWDKVFNTNFFSTREKKEAMAASNVTVLTNLLSKQPNPRPVDKQGGGRFA